MRLNTNQPTTDEVKVLPPEEHGNADVCHVAADRLPRLGDDEHLALGQRNLDGLLEFGETEPSPVVAGHRPLARSARHRVAADLRQHVHRTGHASDRDTHLDNSAAAPTPIKSSCDCTSAHAPGHVPTQHSKTPLRGNHVHGGAKSGTTLVYGL